MGFLAKASKKLQRFREKTSEKLLDAQPLLRTVDDMVGGGMEGFAFGPRVRSKKESLPTVKKRSGLVYPLDDVGDRPRRRVIHRETEYIEE